MIVDSTGRINLPLLAGRGTRLLYIDSLGNIGTRRGSGGRDVYEMGPGSDTCLGPGTEVITMDDVWCPSSPCLKDATPWYEGGNWSSPIGNNRAGTCNYVDFVLMANSVSHIHIKTSGKIGIGLANPTAKFHVFDETLLGSSQNNTTLIKAISGNAAGTNTFVNNVYLRRHTSGSSWTSASLHDCISIDHSFKSPGTDTRTWWERRPHEAVQLWGDATTTHMQLSDESGGFLWVKGKVSIGTMTANSSGTHSDAKLTVDGKILARSLFININASNWADYVFDKNYKLMPLPDVEIFVNEHKHLPNVPSSDELTSSEFNFNVTDIQRITMEKTEELFLYAIDQMKELKKLQREISELKSEIAALKSNSN